MAEFIPASHASRSMRIIGNHFLSNESYCVSCGGPSGGLGPLENHLLTKRGSAGSSCCRELSPESAIPPGPSQGRKSIELGQVCGQQVSGKRESTSDVHSSRNVFLLSCLVEKVVSQPLIVSCSRKCLHNGTLNAKSLQQSFMKLFR